jgi:ABC-type molybdenum transport system ATPase subunit/photorepair protein PhrA
MAQILFLFPEDLVVLDVKGLEKLLSNFFLKKILKKNGKKEFLYVNHDSENE